jgi:hypothetical protein
MATLSGRPAVGADDAMSGFVAAMGRLPMEIERGLSASDYWHDAAGGGIAHAAGPRHEDAAAHPCRESQAMYYERRGCAA